MAIKASIRRSLSLLGGALILIAALVIYANFVRGEYAIIQELRGTLSAKTNFLENQKAIISQVQNLIAQYQGAQQLQDTVALALPNEEEVAAIFQQLQAIARSSGLTIQSFGLNLLALKPPVINLSFAKNLGTAQVTLRLFGSYEGIKNFLRAAETNVRVMDLRQLRVEQGARPAENAYAYTVVLDTYYQQ